MQEAATPETGPADAPASAESIAAELAAGIGEEAPANDLEEVTQELVNEAEGTGDSDKEPEPEEDATDTAEDVEEPEESTPASDETLVTVKVNGEERQVPLSEAIAGYSRTEDYKAKTAAVAEERRAVEAERASLDVNLKAQYANQLEEATNLFAQFDPVLSSAQNINWEALKESDPAAYVQAQDAVQERLTAIQQMNAHVAQIRQETQQRQQQELQAEREQRFNQAADKIVELRPELADEAKFRTFADETVTYLKEGGFTGEEIIDALDHRVLTLADKARRWDAHEAALKALPERKVIPKSAVKPLTSDGSGSHSPKPRFPAKADRQRKGDWIAQQILSQE
jgi:hypothetical protein